MPKTEKLHQLTMSYYRVIRLHGQLAHAVLEPIGIFPGQPPILFSLLIESGITQKELGERVALRAATLTTLLQRMEKSELIIRQNDADDHRKIRLYLTAYGHEKALEVKAALGLLEAKMFVGFTLKELEQLEKMLEKLGKNLEMNNYVTGGK
ncbi:MAG: MarR family winged helix-turn-helix transcriptional regulator [Culicoidibacterales bacterium]